ncbi:MAG TPA: penicillin acylase family protein, partial [Pseudonocardiaceae bacterium]|nr:penicillin acylase family protein [Pseudonocardiaceae bacterium]
MVSLLAGLDASAVASTDSAVSPSGHYTAVVRRTEFGIPHVLASNFGDLGYGYGFAFAQDNLCTLADQVVTVDGERSRFFGPTANTSDPLAGKLTNLDSDVFHRWVNDSGVVSRTMDQPAPLGPTTQVRQLIAGYVAGVNRYLADTTVAALPDPTCRAKPWVHPITITEMDRILYNVNQIGGIASVPGQIAEAHPAASSAASVPQVRGSGIGSNGIAVGRTGTVDRDGLLLANPHFPWLGSGRFYQVQLTIPGVIDVTGASLYGTPEVEIGHNARVAWTHTVSTAQRFTLYELHLVPGDPTSYVVDGHVERMTSHQITVPVPGGTTTKTVFTSRYGPVVGLGWTATTALAIRGASVDNGRSANEWLAMGEAGDIAGLRAAQNRFQGIPFVNTMAADSHGTAYFADASVVPHVTDAEVARCVDSPFGKSLLPNTIVLDGSTSDCAWGSSPGAITPGIFAPRTDPSLTRTDFVTNSNDSFWLTNPAAPITDEPLIYGDVNTERSSRTLMGLSTIAERLNGTDGFGAPGFTVPTMQAAELSDRNLSGELARDATVALCRANPTLVASDGTAVDVRAACSVLAAWNLHDDPDSQGAVLWRQFWANAVITPDVWTVPFDPAHPATTPNTLNTASAVVRRALADAVRRLAALHVPLSEPLSAAQITNVGGPAIPVPGCGNGEGCYNVVDGEGPPILGANGQ